ncbi:MAG: glycosyltransferase family 2 protein [Prevotella sp.]|nr:glycosyltransferase family 2 protein [Prevotella sp.]
MKLSIIVPVYCVEATLDRCLQSIVSQSFADFEVILVDDGSPDDCPRLCDSWAQRDARISVVHQPNAGLSAARNTGIDRAQGEYLTFVDSDDYLADDTLSQVVGSLGDNDIVEYPIWRFYGAQHQTLLTLEDCVYNNAADYWLRAKAYSHAYACNKVFRRQLFADVRFPSGRVFEDVYTLPQLLRHARRVATISRGMYYYCWNSQGITATARGEELRMLLDAHLTAGMPMDDTYYMHVLNIQMDVCEMTGDRPRLAPRRVKVTGSTKQRLKAIALNTIGIKGICKVNKLIHRFKKPNRS